MSTRSNSTAFIKAQGKKFFGNREHLKQFSDVVNKKGIKAWNRWCDKQPEDYLGMDLRGIDLSRLRLDGINLWSCHLQEADFRKSTLTKARINGANLSGAHFEGAGMKGADLSYTNLQQAFFDKDTILDGAKLIKADLSNTKLHGAKLRKCNLSSANLNGAELLGTDISGSKVIGTSVWRIKTDEFTKQDHLLIGQLWVDDLQEFVNDDRALYAENALETNNIKTAHLLNLLSDRKKIKPIIDSLTDHVVLLLGNFKRKRLLEGMATQLAGFGFLPIIFDFDPSKNRDPIEMVALVAGMSCFVIADISEARSTGLESMLIIPGLKIPFAPVFQKNKKERPLAMFQTLQSKYEWVLSTIEYPSAESLIRNLKKQIVTPCIKMRDKINKDRAAIKR